MGRGSFVGRRSFKVLNGQCVHKGFYCDGDDFKTFEGLPFEEYLDTSDEELLNIGTEMFLRGNCHVFALALVELFGYEAFVIEYADQKKGFHAFCRKEFGETVCYIDARGVTTSFDEFMDLAREFVKSEYRIRKVKDADITEWRADSDNFNGLMLAAERLISEFWDCYSVAVEP